MSLLRRQLYNLSRLTARPLLPPELLIISLTESCNLKCIICNIKKDIAKENLEIDIEKTFDIISQAKEMHIKTIVLSGGEPFLVKEIFEIINFIKKCNLAVSITTNGLFSEQLIDKIAYSQISHLHFSFDGLPEHHDEIRGKGSSARMIQAVSLIRQKNPLQSIGFGTVICSKNCNDVFEMSRIADALRVNNMNFIPYMVDNTDPQHTKKGRAYSALWPDLQDLENLKNNFAKIDSYRFKFLRIERNPDFKSLIDYYSGEKIKKKCFAGYKSMIITSYRKQGDKAISDVFFCQDSCGNVYDTSLKEAWLSKKSRQMRLIAKKCDNPCLQFCHYI